MSTTVLVARLRTSWEQADWGTFKGKLLWIQHMTKSGQIKIKAVGTTWNPAGLGTKTPSASWQAQKCFVTYWTCFWMVTGWGNGNISEQPKPTGTNRALKNFAMFHFPILLRPRTCSTTLSREWFNLFAWATSVWRKESCVQHATFLSHSRPWANFHFMSMICACAARCSWFWWFLQVWSCMLSCGRLRATMDILDVTEVRPYSFCTHLLPTREDTATRICFTIVVVMNPELSKPNDPMHTSVVRNWGELPSICASANSRDLKGLRGPCGIWRKWKVSNFVMQSSA